MLIYNVILLFFIEIEWKIIWEKNIQRKIGVIYNGEFQVVVEVACGEQVAGSVCFPNDDKRRWGMLMIFMLIFASSVATMSKRNMLYIKCKRQEDVRI